MGGFAGRIYQIIGRNRNTYITFNYLWDNGDASATGKVNTITPTTESGMSATLTFADFNGRRLLQQLTFPDGATTVQYLYDGNGNLGGVSLPPNNAAGNRPYLGYAYRSIGSDTILFYYVSPRYQVGCQVGGCNSDGSVVIFTFAGSGAASSTLNYIGHNALLNPIIPDGTGGSLQPGYPTSVYAALQEYYTTGVGTPTYRDNDGHMTNWVVDGAGRPTQSQACTQSTNQGQQCTGMWLVANEAWDADNNLISETDPRGNQSDYAYDVHGNTVAAAAPAPAPGSFRSTRLFTYDGQDNATAYCDPNATHALGLDWTSAPVAPVPGQGGLCPQNTLATRYQWATPPPQPYGQLVAAISPATSTAPTGYQRTFSYDPAPQGGTDYGLPTRVTGTAITQSDPATPARTPQQTFWYDAHGNPICYGTGSGQWLLSYDSLGRVTSTADPDDSVSGSGVCGKTGAQPGWNTTSRTTYFPDGSVATKQSAPQVASGVSTAFTYDVDGNVRSETHHYGCTSVASCTVGVTNKWYDGADFRSPTAAASDNSERKELGYVGRKPIPAGACCGPRAQRRVVPFERAAAMG